MTIMQKLSFSHLLYITRNGKDIKKFWTDVNSTMVTDDCQVVFKQLNTKKHEVREKTFKSNKGIKDIDCTTASVPCWAPNKQYMLPNV